MAGANGLPLHVGLSTGDTYRGQALKPMPSPFPMGDETGRSASVRGSRIAVLDVGVRGRSTCHARAVGERVSRIDIVESVERSVTGVTGGRTHSSSAVNSAQVRHC